MHFGLLRTNLAVDEVVAFVHQHPIQLVLTKILPQSLTKLKTILCKKKLPIICFRFLDAKFGLAMDFVAATHFIVLISNKHVMPVVDARHFLPHHNRFALNWLEKVRIEGLV